jgi:hypothetical protein
MVVGQRWWGEFIRGESVQSTVKFFHFTITNTMDQYVIYNREYQVLICRQHKYAIPPDRMFRHLQDFHMAIPLATRQVISDYSTSVNLVTPENITMPNEPVQCIDGLSIVNGFECQHDGCAELCGTERSIKEHCRRIHEWKAKTGVLWRNQTVQSFFEGPYRK